KLRGDNFPAKRRSDRRPAIFVASVALARSPASLSSGDEVPHIITRKSRLQPGEFLVTSGKDFCNKICQKETLDAAATQLHRHKHNPYYVKYSRSLLRSSSGLYGLAT